MNSRLVLRFPPRLNPSSNVDSCTSLWIFILPCNNGKETLFKIMRSMLTMRGLILLIGLKGITKSASSWKELWGLRILSVVYTTQSLNRRQFVIDTFSPFQSFTFLPPLPLNVIQHQFLPLLWCMKPSLNTYRIWGYPARPLSLCQSMATFDSHFMFTRCL